MSRRASILAKQEKRKPRVRFPDELIFLDNIKGNDIQACHSMLRRASVQLDINGLDSSGLTPIHNAVLEGNLAAVRLLVQHGADINRKDSDHWTPLHAACANGEADIARYLLSKGANKDIKTNDGERPLDLCDARDFKIISVMLESDKSRKARMLSVPDEELEEGLDDDNKRNDNSDGDSEDKVSSKLSSMADSSPANQGKNARIQNDIKNANADPQSQTSGTVKGMNNLKVGGNKTSSLLTPSAARQRFCPSPATPVVADSHVPNVPVTPKPPKPAGQSILKKSPQQFRTVAE